MGARVEEPIGGAMQALTERDSDLARRLNRMEIDIDDRRLRVLARRQPVASNLGFLTMALEIVQPEHGHHPVGVTAPRGTSAQ